MYLPSTTPNVPTLHYIQCTYPPLHPMYLPSTTPNVPTLHYTQCTYPPLHPMYLPSTTPKLSRLYSRRTCQCRCLYHLSRGHDLSVQETSLRAYVPQVLPTFVVPKTADLPDVSYGYHGYSSAAYDASSSCRCATACSHSSRSRLLWPHPHYHHNYRRYYYYNSDLGLVSTSSAVPPNAPVSSLYYAPDAIPPTTSTPELCWTSHSTSVYVSRFEFLTIKLLPYIIVIHSFYINLNL